MNRIKKALALAVSIVSVMSITACGGKKEEDVSQVEKVEIEDTTLIADIPDGAQKEIIWMGTYDLNPRKGQDISVEMDLFNKRGGSVKWIQVSDSKKFDKLASAIMAEKDVPDIFKYEWMAFPCQVLKDMYQPVDPIVDFDAPLWADTKVSADQFMLSDKHFVAPISYSVGTLMMYDARVIEDNGLNDPYEEYLNGNWNWDTWVSTMTDFCEGAPADSPRYGINGWFQTQVIQQTGKTMINYENGKFVSNLDDPDIERAETMLYDIGKKGYVNTDWLGNAKMALSDGSVLFYCMGTWAMTGNNGPSDGDDWRVVPVPTDPNNDEKVMTADMTAYMWVKGSTANDAVKTWFECCRLANTDEAYVEAGKEKFLNANPNWTEEMYQVFLDASSNENRFMFDYGYGISYNMSDDNSSSDGNCVTRKLYEFTNKEDENGKQYTWTELRETYASTVDSELKAINTSVDQYLANN
ncbi:MAG: extracellular solute-binding protein [Ruminococcus sp.]|nr:extracellular solute-binding protein [Ruminococcus sp.]